MSEKTESANTLWERETLERLLLENLREQRRVRFWRVFFRLIYIAVFCAVLFVLLPVFVEKAPTHARAHTALVDIQGIIGPGGEASADNVIRSLKEAFNDSATKGVILRINSPGGSPVDSGEIYDAIRQLRQQHSHVPVYAVIADIGASGAYYIAASADKIYANRASLVGSIGVLLNGFGFVKGMQHWGVERRLLTAGRYKGFLDPFSPLSQFEQHHAQTLLNDIHQQFIARVKQGRGKRLKKDPLIFSGLIWTGQQAIALGLIDDLATTSFVAEKVIGAKEQVDYTQHDDLLSRLAGKIGAQAAEKTLSALGLLKTPKL